MVDVMVSLAPFAIAVAIFAIAEIWGWRRFHRHAPWDYTRDKPMGH